VVERDAPRWFIPRGAVRPLFLPLRPGSAGPPLPPGEEGLRQTRPDVLTASVAPAPALLKDRFAAAQRRARRARP